MPEKNNSGIVSVSITPGLRVGSRGFGNGPAARNDRSESGTTSGNGRSQPAHVRAMAAVVAGRFLPEFVLAMGSRATGRAGRRAKAAIIVVGVFSKATG